MQRTNTKNKRRQANQKLDNLNTIAALTYHIDCYLAGILNAFDNGRLEIHDRYCFDLSPIEHEADWTELIQTFMEKAEWFVKRCYCA